MSFLTEAAKHNLYDKILPLGKLQDGFKGWVYHNEIPDYLSYVKDLGAHPRYYEAFAAVERRNYIPEEFRQYAYLDKSFKANGYPVMTQPSTLFGMLTLLDPQQGTTLLHIGGGSGFTDAVLSKLVGESGHVYSIERDALAATRARENLYRDGVTNVTVIKGDGANGWLNPGHYDGILFTAAPANFSESLKAQMNEGAKAVAVLGKYSRKNHRVEGLVHTITKNNGVFGERIDREPLTWFVPIESSENAGYTHMGLGYFFPSSTLSARIRNFSIRR